MRLNFGRRSTDYNYSLRDLDRLREYIVSLMQTAGIIGGIGPESTVVYYRGIIKEYQHRTSGASAPSFIINSIDLQRVWRSRRCADGSG